MNKEKCKSKCKSTIDPQYDTRTLTLDQRMCIHLPKYICISIMNIGFTWDSKCYQESLFSTFLIEHNVRWTE